MYVTDSNVLREVSPLDVHNGILNIPHGVVRIGRDSIVNLNIKTIVFPDTLRIIESNAIHGTDLIRVEIPSQVEQIEDNAFSNNNWLTSFIVSSPNTKFTGNALSYCRSLDMVQVGLIKYPVHCLLLGAPYRILSKKQIGVYQIFYVELFKRTERDENEKLPEKLYVAQKGGVAGDGSSIKRAMENCDKKYLTPDIIQAYKNITLDTKIGVDDYRRITGACDTGAIEWLKEHNLTEDDRLPVRDVIQLLDGDYGSSIFTQFVADRYKERSEERKNAKK